MTAVDTLHRAAALIRERAEAATPGPWAAGRSWAGENAVMSSAFNGHAVAVCGDEHPGPYPASADAAHIATLHPLVALIVADWLDGVAEEATSNEECDGFDPNVTISGYGDALRLACVVVGEAS